MPPCMAIAHMGLYMDDSDQIPSNRSKTVRFSRFVLQTLWLQSDLQERFKKAGWNAAHFCVREPIVRSALRQSLLTAIQPCANEMGKEAIEDSLPQDSVRGVQENITKENNYHVSKDAELNNLLPLVRLSSFLLPVFSYVRKNSFAKLIAYLLYVNFALLFCLTTYLYYIDLSFVIRSAKSMSNTKIHA